MAADQGFDVGSDRFLDDVIPGQGGDQAQTGGGQNTHFADDFEVEFFRHWLKGRSDIRPTNQS